MPGTVLDNIPAAGARGGGGMGCRRG
eukprot:SAG31_NODE_24387_length_482_cov_1.493473_1_plen_25_part_10